MSSRKMVDKCKKCVGDDSVENAEKHLKHFEFLDYVTRHKCLLVVRTAKLIWILLLIFIMIHWETQVNYICPSLPYSPCSENRHDKNQEGLKRLGFLRFVNCFGIFGEEPKHCWLLFKQFKESFLNCLKLELLNIKIRSIPKSCHFEQLSEKF